MLQISRRPARYSVLAVFLVLAAMVGASPGRAQQDGPLAQFRENVHQMHIIASYFTTTPFGRIHVLLAQTVTAVAVRSTATETFWVAEREHLDPEFFYQRNVPPGTPLNFYIFVDIADIAGIIQGKTKGDPIEVFKMSEHYAVLKEARSRAIPEMPITGDPRQDEPAVIAWPQDGGLTGVPTFVEKSTTIVEAPEGAPLFFIAFSEKDDERTHGIPVFVQRDGLWKLAGIRVAHGRSTQADRSAAAKLPPVEELLKIAVRVLDSSEYRVVQTLLGDIVLELHNVREPQNAKNVQVTVEARINFIPRTFQETMDIVNGQGTKTIRLGRIGEQVEVQRVTIRLL